MWVNELLGSFVWRWFMHLLHFKGEGSFNKPKVWGKKELKSKFIWKVFNLQSCCSGHMWRSNRMLLGTTRGCLDNDHTDIYDEMYQQFILNLVTAWMKSLAQRYGKGRWSMQMSGGHMPHCIWLQLQLKMLKVKQGHSVSLGLVLNPRLICLRWRLSKQIGGAS